MAADGYCCGTLNARGLRYLAQAPALGAVHDEAGAARGTAAAGVQRPFGEGETVVERQLGARGDVAAGGDPHSATDHLDAAIGGAGVVDQARDVAAGAAVEVVAASEIKNIDGVIAVVALAGEALRFAAGSLGLGNAFAGVFDHARAVGDQLARVDPATVDGGLAGGDPARVGLWARTSEAGRFFETRRLGAHGVSITDRVGGGKRFRGVIRLGARLTLCRSTVLGAPTPRRICRSFRLKAGLRTWTGTWLSFRAAGHGLESPWHVTRACSLVGLRRFPAR